MPVHSAPPASESARPASCAAQRRLMPQLTANLSPVHAPAAYGWMLRWRMSTEQVTKPRPGGLSRPRRSTFSRNRTLTSAFAMPQKVPDSATYQRRPDRCPGAVHRGPMIVPHSSAVCSATAAAGAATSANKPQITIDAERDRIALIVESPVPTVKRSPATLSEPHAPDGQPVEPASQ